MVTEKFKWVQPSSQYVQAESRRQILAFTEESFCYPGTSEMGDGKILKGLYDMKLVASRAGLMDQKVLSR